MLHSRWYIAPWQLSYIVRDKCLTGHPKLPCILSIIHNCCLCRFSCALFCQWLALYSFFEPHLNFAQHPWPLCHDPFGLWQVCWACWLSNQGSDWAWLLPEASTLTNWDWLPCFSRPAHKGHPAFISALSLTFCWNELLHTLQFHAANTSEPHVRLSKGLEFASSSYSSAKSGLSSFKSPRRPGPRLFFEHCGQPDFRLLLFLGVAKYSRLHSGQDQRLLSFEPRATWSAGRLSLCHCSFNLQRESR